MKYKNYFDKFHKFRQALLPALLTACTLRCCSAALPARSEEIISLPNGYSEDGLWMYNDYGDGTVSVTCQDNTVTEAVIPSEIDGRTITMVELDCFKDNPALRKVTLPPTITVIEDYAFYQCYGLEELNVPESVEKIGFQAFYGCQNLKTISIPANVTEIEGFAFEGCNKLEAVHVAKANACYTDEDGVLFNHDKTELLLYPSAKQGTTYAVPESCTKLESYAFMANACLQEIDLHPVQEMGEDVFYCCTSLQELTIPAGITELKGSLLGNCTALHTVTLPEGITTLGSGCFYNCVSLEQLELPASLTTIQDYAFFNCASLKRLTIPDTVQSIGAYALGFYYGSDSTGQPEQADGTQGDSLQRLPDFEIDAANGTEAFAYAAEYSIRCTGGITQGIVFVYILLGVVAVVILVVIFLLIMQKRYRDAHELH